jgi:hypothetical protein
MHHVSGPPPRGGRARCNGCPLVNRRAIVGVLSLASFGLLAACDRAEPTSSHVPSGSQEPTPGVSNAQPTSLAATNRDATAFPVQVVNELAEAWCGQQRLCDQVGTGRQYATFFDCLTQTRDAVRGDLTTFDCPPDVDTTRTPPCMAEIGQMDCSRNVGTPLALPDCHREVLCAK